MNESQARKIIANDLLTLSMDDSLPTGMRKIYRDISANVLNGNDRSFTCLQKIEYLITGKSIPLLPM